MTARIESSEVHDYYTASGTLNAKTTSDLAARIIGTVTSIQVKEGDKVIKDQLLLTIDDRDIRQKVVAAEEAFNESVKNLEAARQHRNLLNSTHKRYSELYREKAITSQEMDEIATKNRVADLEFERAQAAKERARANLQESIINLDYTKIKSPVNGIVTHKEVEIGNTVVPGTVLIIVEDNSLYRLEVMVDEKLLNRLQLGNTVEINVDALNKKTNGQISEILPHIDPATRSFLVKIDINNTKSLRSGLFARASIQYDTREAILVPQDAIVQKGQLTGVYTVEDRGIVNYRLVRVGSSFMGGTEILSGLKIGDIVIIGGIEKVIDGGIINNN